MGIEIAKKIGNAVFESVNISNVVKPYATNICK